MTRDAGPRPGAAITGLLLCLLANGAGAWQAHVSGTPDVTESARPPPPVPSTPRIERPATGEVLHTGRPVLEGVADPDTRVEVEVDGTVLGRIKSDDQGRWSYTVDTGEALPVGTHRAVAYGVGVAQERSEPSVAVDFDIQPRDLEVAGGCTGGGPGAPWLPLCALLALAALRRGRPA